MMDKSSLRRLIIKEMKVVLAETSETSRFAATSKESGKTVFFKNREDMNDAIKAGTHEPVTRDDPKQEPETDDQESKPTVNIFDEPKQEPKQEKSLPKIPMTKIKPVESFLDNNERTIYDMFEPGMEEERPKNLNDYKDWNGGNWYWFAKNIFRLKAISLGWEQA